MFILIVKYVLYDDITEEILCGSEDLKKLEIYKQKYEENRLRKINLQKEFWALLKTYPQFEEPEIIRPKLSVPPPRTKEEHAKWRSIFYAWSKKTDEIFNQRLNYKKKLYNRALLELMNKYPDMEENDIGLSDSGFIDERFVFDIKEITII